ncbi:alpha/beta fold hydrolase [Xanthomonas phaseoli pv. phaseoli]|nr:alpha/beta fold hydrolase [Xanthomonas phaseoli pv. phaseoli]
MELSFRNVNALPHGFGFVQQAPLARGLFASIITVRQAGQTSDLKCIRAFSIAAVEPRPVAAQRLTPANRLSTSSARGVDEACATMPNRHTRCDMAKPTLFFLHALGASRHEWSRVIARFGGRFDCIALDIPGFGDAPALDHFDTNALVDWFSAEVIKRQPACWFVVGHSMGGKIATLTAARARDGVAGLAGLAGWCWLLHRRQHPNRCRNRDGAPCLPGSKQGSPRAWRLHSSWMPTAPLRCLMNSGTPRSTTFCAPHPVHGWHGSHTAVAKTAPPRQDASACRQ